MHRRQACVCTEKACKNTVALKNGLFYFVRAYYCLLDGYAPILKKLSDLLYFLIQVSIESRASDSTSEAIFVR